MKIDFFFFFSDFLEEFVFLTSTPPWSTPWSTRRIEKDDDSSRISKGIPTRRFLPFSALGHLSSPLFCTASLYLVHTIFMDTRALLCVTVHYTHGVDDSSTAWIKRLTWLAHFPRHDESVLLLIRNAHSPRSFHVCGTTRMSTPASLIYCSMRAIVVIFHFCKFIFHTGSFLAEFNLDFSCIYV